MKESRFKHAISSMRLRSRLLLFFVILFIIPVIVMSAASYWLSFNAIKTRATQYAMQTVDRTSYEVDELLLNAYKIADMIAKDPTVQEPLRNSLDTDMPKRYSMDLKTDTRLNFMQSYGEQFFGFYVIGENGGKYKSNYCSIRSEDLREAAWYTRIMRSDGPVWFSSHLDSFAVETTGQPFISAGLRVIDRATGKVSGAVLIDIEQDQISSKLNNSVLSETGYMFLIDTNNKVIINQSSEISADVLEKLRTNEKQQDAFITDFYFNNIMHRSVVIYKESSLTGWKVGGIIPIKELTRDSNKIGVIMVGMLLSLSILYIIAAWYTSNSVANPIQKLMFLMRKVEDGDLSVSMNVKYNDEIGQLGRSFNIMIEKIGFLMDSAYQEQKKLRKAELKALQAQINPHFLYNTLDSIIWMSKANRNDDVIAMVTALTRLFRIALSKGRDVIYIQEEIEHINNYLTIQHIRYKNKFTYDIQVDESLLKHSTIKLILQPIIENALYHGIKEKRGIGHIQVFGHDLDDIILFEVVDNGKGMSTEKLNALNNTLRNEAGPKIEIYGIKNVDERIKIFFGPEYGLTFISVENEGTKVQIKLPKVLEVEDVGKSTIS
jgi:two-component system, sensor histidine kinase YesM